MVAIGANGGAQPDDTYVVDDDAADVVDDDGSSVVSR